MKFEDFKVGEYFYTNILSNPRKWKIISVHRYPEEWIEARDTNNNLKLFAEKLFPYCYMKDKDV